MEGGVEHVQVRSDEINNNNVQTASTSPYRYTDLSTNLPLERPSAVQPGVAQCDMCFQRFGTFSLLYKHRARPCFEDGVTQPPFPHPVKIAFHRDHLLYIGDIVHALNLPLQDDEEREGWVWVVVDRSMFEITMRRFYVGQVTKYNLEQWYHPLDAKATAQGAHHKGTMSEERETFKAQNPDAGMTDILKLMGEAWKDMPQAQRALLRYEAMAAADKARYTAELASSGANTQLNEWME
ncbi:HMG (high mobility group) box domain containing protein [Acanthamoeba castellanii str. Neff]|uniref:HMG (High mobility group) box domain containing protein n=1 Tax=Acanthamoeba castellanii (strain ATCC 30010 / Neff) TaxID=1257118 RepID=L8HC61_ACACF|nr:HMG (high mobility group) box domain containing protein [Acanthamoeba castellanii str. Neff]ELR22343.1 HMG (high mobility group) box domain containing protein [Acanthamoeba castellanii str. Neff]